MCPFSVFKYLDARRSMIVPYPLGSLTKYRSGPKFLNVGSGSVFSKLVTLGGSRTSVTTQRN